MTEILPLSHPTKIKITSRIFMKALLDDSSKSE